MKKFCLVFRPARLFSILTLSLLFQSAQAQPLFYDGFSYSAGNLRTVGGTLWNGGDSASTAIQVTAAAALAGPPLFQAAVGNGVTMTGGTFKKHNASFTSQSSGTVYCSFLFKASSISALTMPVYVNATTSSSSKPPLAFYVDASGSMGIAKNTVNTSATFFTATNVADGNVHLIVGRYTFNTGTTKDDTVDLWVDPDPSTFGDNSLTPAASVQNVGSGPTDALALTAVFLNHDVAATVMIDEIRVDTTWAGVTPGGTCNPAGIVTNTTPLNQLVNINSTAAFSLVGTGSSPTYQWQVSTDGGASFNNVSTGTGGTSQNYTTAALATSDSGNKYRCVVNVTCGSGSSVTSAVARVTVIDASILSFRSITSGNWNDTNTWQQSADGVNWAAAIITPSATTSNTTVRAGHLVNVTAPVAVDRLVIQAGGEVDASGAPLIITNTGVVSVDCDVFGILQAANVAGSGITNAGANVTFENGSAFIWNSPVAGAIPVATWVNGSTCEVLSGASGVAPAGLNQSFYDFIWNWPGSGLCNLDGQLTTVRHNLTMTGTANSASSVRFLQTGITCNLSVGGDFNVAGGIVTLSGGSAANTVLNLFVGGNFTIASGATLNSRQGKLNAGANSSANIIFTNTAVAQSLTNSGNILHDGDGVGCPINWQIASGVTVNLSGNLPLGPANFSSSDSVIVDGTLNLNGNQITGSGLGTLTIDSTGTLTGSGTSQLAVSLGTINYGGTLNLPGLPTLNNGDSFKLFDAASYVGAFNSFVPSTPGTGLFWDTLPLTASGNLAVTTSGSLTPVIRNTASSGDNFIFSGINGTALVNFSVWSSTDVALPKASWTLEGSGQFDGSGNFSFTNSISGAAKKFFLISVP